MVDLGQFGTRMLKTARLSVVACLRVVTCDA